MVVLCDGMIRSGSTWSFNIAVELIRCSEPHRRAFGFYSENPAVLRAAVRPRFSNLVIKSHALDPSAYELCQTGALKTIYTWRNPYDAIASALRMFGYSVEHWMGALRNALRVWEFHRTTGSACILSYESIMQTPVESIQSVAAYLGLHVAPDEASRIAKATSMQESRSLSDRIVKLDESRVVRKDGYVFDRSTLLHQNHIQDGRVGYGFAFLDPKYLPMINALLREEGFEFLCTSLPEGEPLPESAESMAAPTGSEPQPSPFTVSDIP
jgi:hypothetical protein